MSNGGILLSATTLSYCKSQLGFVRNTATQWEWATGSSQESTRQPPKDRAEGSFVSSTPIPKFIFKSVVSSFYKLICYSDDLL